jgi:hypothetical protein
LSECIITLAISSPMVTSFSTGIGMICKGRLDNYVEL